MRHDGIIYKLIKLKFPSFIILSSIDILKKLLFENIENGIKYS
jgi:hypothetical protein